MKRSIIYHCHFFKNAGSTIDWSLKRNFGESFCENKTHYYSAAEWHDRLKELTDNIGNKVIASHIFALPAPNFDNINLIPILMFRNPVERVISVANFEKKQADLADETYEFTFGSSLAKSMDIPKYIEAYLQDGTPATIRNMHTLRCSGRDNGFPVKNDDFDRAVTLVESLESIGLVERFDESMVLFEEILRPFFPEIDLAYKAQNISRQVEESVDQRINGLKKQLGDKLFGYLLEKNKFDCELYLIVETCFQKRLCSIDNFAGKITEFRRRCSLLG